MQQKILIIETDKDICKLLTVYLTRNGYACHPLIDGNEAVTAVRDLDPSLIILDAQLPDRNSISICQALRRETDIPIVFLSRLSDELHIVRSLNAGGDDYIVKPFSLAELLARVRAMLRRSLPVPPQAAAWLKFSGLAIDLTQAQVLLNGQALPLPPREFEVLAWLARNPGRMFTSKQLLSLIWDETGTDTRTVAVHINRLRKKLNRGRHNQEYILTVWGRGYKFNNQL